MSDFEKYDDILDVEFTLPIDKEFISQVKHCPVVLIVDTSSSMADKIDELNAGVEALKTALMEDDTTHDSVDIAIIEMGMGMAQLSQPFTTVSSWNVKKYSANGVTPMAGAINLAILHINQLKEEYKKRGVRYLDHGLFCLVTVYQLTMRVILIQIGKNLLPSLIRNQMKII